MIKIDPSTSTVIVVINIHTKSTTFVYNYKTGIY